MPALSRRVVLRSLAAALGVGAVATVAPSAASGENGGGGDNGVVPPTGLHVGPSRYEIPGLDPDADNTAAFNAAFAAATPGDELVVPAGTFAHSGIVELSSPQITVDGYGARLLATDPSNAGLHITGSGVTIRGLTHEVDGATERGNGENLDDCPFSIDGADDVVLEDVVSIGARDAGIFLYGAKRARVVNVLVRASFADGVHITNGSASCIIDSPVVLTPGDDAVAVVSYTDDADVCSDIRIDHPLVVNGQGRGVVVSGGDHVVITRPEVRRTRGSGVYVATESGQFDTAAVTHCHIAGGTVDDANWDSTLDTGNIGVFQLVAGSVSTNVVIEGITVTGSQKTANPYIKVGTANGSGGRFDGLVIQDLVLPDGVVYVDGTDPSVAQDGQYSCASAGDGGGAPGGTTITSGPAATGDGITLSRIRR